MAERVKHKGNPHPKRYVGSGPYVVSAILTTKEAWSQRPQTDRQTDLRELFEVVLIREAYEKREVREG